MSTDTAAQMHISPNCDMQMNLQMRRGMQMSTEHRMQMSTTVSTHRCMQMNARMQMSAINNGLIVPSPDM